MQYWKQLKTEKLSALMKYPLKFKRQENLRKYFFDNAIQSINKMDKEKWAKGCILPYPQETLESLRTKTLL